RVGDDVVPAPQWPAARLTQVDQGAAVLRHGPRLARRIEKLTNRAGCPWPLDTLSPPLRTLSRPFAPLNQLARSIPTPPSWLGSRRPSRTRPAPPGGSQGQFSSGSESEPHPTGAGSAR